MSEKEGRRINIASFPGPRKWRGPGNEARINTHC